MRVQEMQAQAERILTRLFKGYNDTMTSEELDAFYGYTQGVLTTLHELEVITDSRFDKLWDELSELYINKEVTE